MINNLPDISKAFGEEKTNEQILDSLQKYRKELNFLLMNLDESNMPAIAGRLEGLDGSFSLVDQQLDQITLAVGDANDGVASLILRADSIESTVSNNSGNISQITQTVDGIQTTVLNNSGNISTISQTVNGIQSTVSSHTTTIGTHTSQITQLSGEISSVVSWTDVTGNMVSSLINQTATTISLSASKIDLTGITTLYDATNTNYRIVATGKGMLYKEGTSNYLVVSYSDPGGANIYSPGGLYLGNSYSTVWFNGGVNFSNAASVNWGTHAPTAKFA